ncbi:MAG: hypothetical protein JXA99_16270 [Candidatus Lokiarchaeota archaeon]|nr:hypothetical protein [Candidatus Lokiarchaeota archaeon]
MEYLIPPNVTDCAVPLAQFARSVFISPFILHFPIENRFLPDLLIIAISVASG